MNKLSKLEFVARLKGGKIFAFMRAAGAACLPMAGAI